MGPSLGGMLAVNKTVDIFTVIIVVRDRHFYIITGQMNNGVANFIFICFSLQEVE
jgi:hypothetical protein